MRILAAVVLLATCVSCEKKPTPEEIEAQQAAERAARPSPTPKFGERLKDYKSPLEKKPGP